MKRKLIIVALAIGLFSLISDDAEARCRGGRIRGKVRTAIKHVLSHVARPLSHAGHGHGAGNCASGQCAK